LTDANQTKGSRKPGQACGRLKIGDDWNAITIIALSQSSPLKAIAELVENSIDARASTVTITRGRENARHFLTIRDDGEGVPRDGEGRPDFRYVATHICDSVKRRRRPRARRVRDRLVKLLDTRRRAYDDVDRPTSVPIKWSCARAIQAMPLRPSGRCSATAARK